MKIYIEIEDDNYKGGRDVVAKFDYEVELPVDDIFNPLWDTIFKDIRVRMLEEYTIYKKNIDDPTTP